MLNILSLLIEAAKRDKAGLIMFAIAVVLMKPSITWWDMSCIGLMFIAFLIRNIGKLKDDKDDKDM